MSNQKIIILKGLPASGKSTWAKEYMKAHSEFKRINRDDLREMLSNYVFSNGNEALVTKVSLEIQKACLLSGFSFILDETSLNPRVESSVRTLIKDYQESTAQTVDLEINDSFLEVSYKECIKRDEIRGLLGGRSVGKKVIMEMYNKYLRDEIQEVFYQPPTESLEDVVICDIDGTIAIMKNRSPFDWKKVGEDLPNKVVIEAVKNSGYHIIFMSGRDSICRTETENWLRHYFPVSSWELFMRSNNDNRDDTIVKRELFFNHVHGKYNPRMVFDDRRKVVVMWRSLGLTCFEVADHDF